MCLAPWRSGCWRTAISSARPGTLVELGPPRRSGLDGTSDTHRDPNRAARRAEVGENRNTARHLPRIDLAGSGGGRDAPRNLAWEFFGRPTSTLAKTGTRRDTSLSSTWSVRVESATPLGIWVGVFFKGGGTTGTRVAGWVYLNHCYSGSSDINIEPSVTRATLGTLRETRAGRCRRLRWRTCLPTTACHTRGGEG